MSKNDVPSEVWNAIADMQLWADFGVEFTPNFPDQLEKPDINYLGEIIRKYLRGE